MAVIAPDPSLLPGLPVARSAYRAPEYHVSRQDAADPLLLADGIWSTCDRHVLREWAYQARRGEIGGAIEVDRKGRVLSAGRTVWRQVRGASFARFKRVSLGWAWVLLDGEIGVYVHPRFRGRGLARKLLARLPEVDFAKDRLHLPLEAPEGFALSVGLPRGPRPLGL